MKSIISYTDVNISEISEKIRYILEFFFDKGEKAAQAHKNICAVYGEDAVSYPTAKRWFVRLISGNFDVKDSPRTGRPICEKVDEILKKVEEDRHISSYDIAKELNISQQTVLNNLHKIGYTKKLDVWVPHKLTEKKFDGPSHHLRITIETKQIRTISQKFDNR